MEIVVMENNMITKKGKAILMLCSEDYKEYNDKINAEQKHKQKCKHEFCESPSGFERCIKCKEYF